MNPHLEARLTHHFATNLGVITRAQARALGLEPTHVAYLVRSGRWRQVHRGVYSRNGFRLPVRAQIMAACLAAGPSGLASHSTAAWLWELLPDRPQEVELTIERGTRRIAGVRLHRRSDVTDADRALRGPIPVTSVIRTLCDLGESAPSRDLEEAVDRAFARRLVTASGLEAALRRLSRRGRAGPAQLRRCLEEAGVVGAPHPSVLESRVRRLLRSWGIVPLRCEAMVFGGTYRLDFLLAPKLALEVDGFTYHASPRSKAADTARRNQLTLAGYVVIQTDWLEVTRRPQSLRTTIQRALVQARPA